MIQPARYFSNQTNSNSSPWTISMRIKMLAWQFAWKLLCAWTPKPANRWRLIVLKMFGAKIYGRPFVHQRARIQIPWHLTLRHRATLGDRANAYSLGEIEIGEHSTIAQEVYLCTGTHDFSKSALNLMTAPIHIGKGVFVGARSFVMPGVEIGANAVVGACSLVLGDVPPNSIVAGHPAKLIGLRTGELLA